MEYYARSPLEVFAIDGSMNRCTGSIPYTSLIWHRRYYSPGEFLISVFSDVYDPSWSYICCSDRPELGMIQKVEFDDSSQTEDGRDTVMLSGFFLEQLFDNCVFLVEQTGSKTVEIEAPKNPNVAFGTLNQYYMKIGYSTVTGEYVYRWANTKGHLPEDTPWRDENGDVVSFGGVEEIPDDEVMWSGKEIPGTDARPEGPYYVNDQKGYYTDNGGETIKGQNWWDYEGSYDADPTEYDVLANFGDRFLVARDDVVDGSKYYIVTGVADNADDAWSVDYYDWYRGPKERVVAVQGPWQRTPIGDPEESGDVVQLLMKWAQWFFRGNLNYVEPEIKGPTGVLDISLKYLSDLFYDTLRAFEASYRIVYNFPKNTMTLQIYKGDDLSQSAQGGGDIPEPEPGVLPDGFTLLEYVTATGTQHIDTGVTPDDTTRVQMDAAIDAPGSGNEAVFGGRDAAATNVFGVWLADGWLGPTFGSNAFQEYPLYISYAGQRLTYDLDGNVFSCGGQSVTLADATFSSSSTITLFAINSGGSVDQRKASGDLYAARVYKGGELVRDFVPARREQDGAVGMYDVENGVMYTGYGTFIAGPVAAGTYAAALAGPVALSVTPRAASGYTDIEYIESTGTQYIDSGISAQGGFTASMDFMFTQAHSGYQCMVGAHEQESPYYRNYFMASQGFTQWNMGAFDPYLWGTPQTNTRYSVEVCTVHGQLSCVINGSNQGIPQFDTDSRRSSRTLYVFANNYPDDLQTARARLYSMTISVGGETVRNFRPVRRDSDGAVGLYDSVSGQFFGNAGTGTFVSGPDVQVSGQLTIVANDDAATGSMDVINGIVGQYVTLPHCGYAVDGKTFSGYGTTASGGTVYQPMEQYVLSRESDTLFCQWEEGQDPDSPSRWAVFNDTWGSMVGYRASRDESGYKNRCFVLYDYEVPSGFTDDGSPAFTIRTEKNESGEDVAHYRIKHSSRQGYYTVDVGDDSEQRRETFLDKRDDKPPFDQLWPRDEIDQETYDDLLDSLKGLKGRYDAWASSLRKSGEDHLIKNYPVVYNLETGTLDTDGYIREYDLGDKVDWYVSKAGIMQTARITEVEEVYESGNIQINLTIGDELVTTVDRARRS